MGGLKERCGTRGLIQSRLKEASKAYGVRYTDIVGVYHVTN